MRPILIVIIGLLLAVCAPARAQVADSVDYSSPQYRLRMQRSIFPQEKFHVMTDREFYQPGDTVWFRAWVQDGPTLQESRLGSRYLYLELLDDSLRLFCKVREREGRFCGQFRVPLTLRSGNYTLAAFTHYMGFAIDSCLFRKQLHVLAPTDVAAGSMPRALYERRTLEAPLLPVSDGAPAGHGERLTRVSFPAPAGVWLAVSVTDDALTPADTATSIARMLPQVPDLFTIDQLPTDGEFYQPHLRPERRTSLQGEVTRNGRPEPDAQVTLINLKTTDIVKTRTDATGHFHLLDADIPEGTAFLGIPSLKDGSLLSHIRFIHPALPTHIVPIATPFSDAVVNVPAEQQRYLGSRHDVSTDYLRRAQPSASLDSVIMLDEVVKAAVVNDRDKAFIANIIDNEYDPFTAHAKDIRTYEEFNFDESQLITVGRYLSRHHWGISIADGIASRATRQGQKVPVRFVIESREDTIAIDADGHRHQRALDFPLMMLDRLELIEPADAQQILPDAQQPDAAIVRLKFMPMRDLVMLHSRYLTIPMGYQQQLHFPTYRIRHADVATRYWNPAVCASPEGRVSIDLPLPSGSQPASYTLRAEGITPEGEPVALIYRISR